MTTFLACPFCGSLDIDTDGPCYTQPMCNGCGASVYDQPSRADAIAAWNRRASPQPQAHEAEPRYGYDPTGPEAGSGFREREAEPSPAAQPVAGLQMNIPIWVWLYDYGPHTHPEVWTSGCKVEALPQAHSYAFPTEEAALAHPAAMGWPKDHAYVLQKTYLQAALSPPRTKEGGSHDQGLEEAALVADARRAELEALIDKGKGTHGQPDYVRDDTWSSWLGERSAAERLSSAIRALKGRAK